MYKHREKTRRYKARKAPSFHAKKVVPVYVNTSGKTLNNQDGSLSQSKSDVKTSRKNERTSSKKSKSNFNQIVYHKKSFFTRVVGEHPLVFFINVLLFTLIFVMIAAFLINPELASVNNNDTVESNKTHVGVENDINISVTDSTEASAENENTSSEQPENAPSNLANGNTNNN